MNLLEFILDYQLGEPTIRSARSPWAVSAWSAFLMPLRVYGYPSSCPRVHCTPNKSVPTLRYTRRHGPICTGPYPKALIECSPLDFRRSSIRTHTHTRARAHARTHAYTHTYTRAHTHARTHTLTCERHKNIRECCRLVLWRSEQSQHLRHKYLLRYEPTVFCSLLQKSGPRRLNPGELTYSPSRGRLYCKD